jgi:integrase
MRAAIASAVYRQHGQQPSETRPAWLVVLWPRSAASSGAMSSARVEGPSQDPKRREALTGAEVARVAEAAEAHRLSGCWLLTLNGLRRSEVMGLRWSDIADDGTLTVERGRVLVDGHDTSVGPPKTKRSVRELPLPPHIRKALAVMRTRRDEEMLALGRRVQPDDYLAVDEVGRPLRPERYSDEWRELCKAAGVRPVVLHAARHSSVTAMRDRGVPDHIVARWHGHDETIMRAVYSDAFAEEMAKAGEVIGGVIDGGRSAGLL